MRNDTRFEIDRKLVAPEPFDDAVAFLEVQPESNHVDGGVDLTLSATIGAESVQIPLDNGEVIDVKLDIFRADISVYAINCSSVALPVDPLKSGFRTDENVSKASNRNQNYSLGTDNRLNAAGKLGAGEASTDNHVGASVSGGQNSSHEASAKTSYSQVEYFSRLVRIKPNPTPEPTPIDRKVIDAAKCIRLVPIIDNQAFGAVLSLKVRHNWLQISDPKPVGLLDTGRTLSKVWKKIATGTDDSDKFHLDAFTELVKHLIVLGLQPENDRTFATLAAEAVRVLPSNPQDSAALNLPYVARPYVLPVEDLKLSLSGTQTQVTKLLRDYGVPEDSIPLPTGETPKDIEQIDHTFSPPSRTLLFGSLYDHLDRPVVLLDRKLTTTLIDISKDVILNTNIIKDLPIEIKTTINSETQSHFRLSSLTEGNFPRSQNNTKFDEILISKPSISRNITNILTSQILKVKKGLSEGKKWSNIDFDVYSDRITITVGDSHGGAISTTLLGLPHVVNQDGSYAIGDLS